MGETDILREILAVPLPSVRLFRNQVGTAKVHGQYVTTGLGKGSSDLIGFRTISINGTRVAQFLAIEVKDDSGKPSQDQLDFIREVSLAGGKAFIARSVEDVLRELS